ncbi:MAG: SxtJ family membrane protein [Pseudomonadales bacterium]
MEPLHETEIEVGSSRSFGMVFAAVFAIIAAWPLLSGGDIRWWSAAIAIVFLGLGLFLPGVLDPLNRVWFKFGMLLARIVNPIVMFVIYVISVLPIGAILRLSGKDLLRLRFEPDSQSYWIERDPPGPERPSLEEVF